jgi:hypothetical protein
MAIWWARRSTSSGAILDLVGLFRVLDPASFPDSLVKEGMGFSADLWSQMGAQGVAKLRAAHEAAASSSRGACTKSAAATPRC